MSKVETSLILSQLKEPGIPLLDAVFIEHGPRDHLGRIFLAAEALAARAGLYICVHFDMASLIDANERMRPIWGQVAPAFSPHQSRLPSRQAFWLAVHDNDDRLVSVSAAKLMILDKDSFAETLTSLRLWYADPTPHLAKGTHCLVEGKALRQARKITGRVVYSGALWTHPAFRGNGIAYMLPRLNRYLALAHWDADYTAAVIKVDLGALGMLGRYGYRNIEKVVYLRNCYMGDLIMSLIWQDRSEMENELASYLEEAEGVIARMSDMTDTMRSWPASHGSISRS